EPRHVLANVVAGQAGGDRPKLPANFRRRLRLHIECVVLCRAALLKQDDARTGRSPPAPGRRRGRGRYSCLEKPRQRQPTDPERSKLQDIAASIQTAPCGCEAVSCFHGSTSLECFSRTVDDCSRRRRCNASKGSGSATPATPANPVCKNQRRDAVRIISNA